MSAIVSNFRPLSRLDSIGLPVRVPEPNEDVGLKWVLERSGDHDTILINGDSALLLRLAALRAAGRLRTRLVGLDIVLPTPRSTRQRVLAPVRRRLFREVDFFIHYFTDLAGYERHYGIGSARSAYVPFKPNLRQHLASLPDPVVPGDYVLAMGRSNRDYPTFLRAMGEAGVPGRLLFPGNSELRLHGSAPIHPSMIPANVEVVEHHGSYLDWVSHLLRARAVVVPLRGDTITAAGISVYLDAMLLGKCVIITRGPSTNGILTSEAIIVAPETAADLARAITTVWNDPSLRSRTQAAGIAYARSLEGTDRVTRDVVRLVTGAAGNGPNAARE